VLTEVELRVELISNSSHNAFKTKIEMVLVRSERALRLGFRPQSLSTKSTRTGASLCFIIERNCSEGHSTLKEEVFDCLDRFAEEGRPLTTYLLLCGGRNYIVIQCVQLLEVYRWKDVALELLSSRRRSE
jgi:hypothetical protein